MEERIEPSAIKDVVKKIIAGLDGSGPKRERISREEIRAFWEKAAGKSSSRKSSPVSLRKGRLIVNVEDSSLLYDLTLRKAQILKKLSKDLKGDIKEIQFRIGEI